MRIRTARSKCAFMSETPSFATRRFQSAADHYLAGRAPYPATLIASTAASLDLGREDRLLDLGCGPAQLAVAFAPYVKEVLALDPEPNMIALARAAARDLPNVTVSAGSSDDLGADLGRFRCVVIGRAFHWMQREETLRRLDTLIVPGGAVVLFGDERPTLPENEWVKEFEALIERYSADDPDRTRRRSDAFLPHLSVLLDSPFSALERISHVYRRAITAQDLVERALSQSSTSRARLGARADAMVVEIEALPVVRSNRPLAEALSSSALIARRPAA